MTIKKILSESIFTTTLEEPTSISRLKNTEVTEIIMLSIRAENCLKRANIITIYELISKSIPDLFAIRNAGKKTVQELIDKVHDLGLKFRGED